MERLSDVMTGMAGSEQTPPLIREAFRAAEQEGTGTMTKQEIMPREANAVAAMTPMDMLDRAISSGAGVEVLEKLMSLQERWETNQARKAFDNAMAAAKAEIPVIFKNKTVDFTSQKGRTSYRHEDLAEIARTVDPILTKHGLSYRFRTDTTQGAVGVICIVSHRDGHSEANALSAARDDSGNKNSIQAVGSTITYLQRYTLKAALGLAASTDNDAKDADDKDEPVSADQVEQMRALIVAAGLDLPQTLGFFKIERLEDMAASHFDRAIALLRKRAEKAKTAEPA